MMDRVRRIAAMFLVAATAVGLFASCSDDDDTPSLTFASSALYFGGRGVSATASFSATNIQSVSITAYPEGWTAEADFASRTVTVTAPDASDESADESGTVTLTGVAASGTTVTASISVSITPTVDLDAVQSNCFIVSQPNTCYRFDATRKGETSETLATASVEVLWKTATKVLQDLRFDNGRVTFYIPENSDEDDGLLDGNALLAAYDAQGVLLWSWHIWVTDYDPDEASVTLGGKTFMARNLGACANDNSTTGEVLKSFGLFYQWGRKDPFVGPSAYNAAGSTDATLYNGSGSYTYLSYTESTAEIGTESYARQHPMTFITGVEESGYDWLYSAHDASRWSETKSVNDPCPKGWRVPSGDAFEGLEIVESLAEGSDYADSYGWTLGDGSSQDYFPAGGRRTYLYGKIQNLNTNEERPMPWAGYYWTVAAEADNSVAMYFDLASEDVPASRLLPAAPYQRANGMLVRCVKE